MEHKNLIAAYKVANDNTREVLRKLYPKVDFEGGLKAEQKANRLVTERIKTFDDAVDALGEKNPLVEQYRLIEAAYGGDELTHDLIAYLKLRIICAALNEGWEPSFTKKEVRWYPWHCLWTEEKLAEMTEQDKRDCAMISTDDYDGYKTDYFGFSFACMDSGSSDVNSFFASRLCFRNRELSAYAGRQFIELYADFNLIRK